VSCGASTGNSQRGRWPREISQRPLSLTWARTSAPSLMLRTASA